MQEVKIQEIVQEAVEIAQKLGASQSEAFCTESRELSVEIRDQEIDTLKISEDTGLGVRILINDRMGFAFTSDLSSRAVKEAIRTAVNNAKKVSPDSNNFLPAPPDGGYKDYQIYDENIEKTPLRQKVEFAQEVERCSRAFDRRVSITESCAYQDASYKVALANSLGIGAFYKGAFCGSYAQVVAQQDGESQSGFGMQFKRNFRGLDPDALGREAAQKAIRMLGAKDISTQRAAVIFDPYIATNFLGIITPALSAESVQKGKSLLGGKLGQEVASPLVNIIDDGTLKEGLLTAPFDGEGVASQKTVLVAGGTLKSYLHNTYTAAKDGVLSTGNGIRNSFKGTPEVGTTNIYIEPGEVSRERLISEVEKGLYITQVMGMHTANPISGDFSVGVSGLWIEKGEFEQPVRGVTIAGNMIDLLRAIDGVANDLTFFVGQGAPTLRVSSMTISG